MGKNKVKVYVEEKSRGSIPKLGGQDNRMSLMRAKMTWWPK